MGLDLGSEKAVRPNIQRSERQSNEYSEGMATVTATQMEVTFESRLNMHDKFKLGLMFIL